MGKLSLTKSGLHKQREELKLFQRVLPSLDLKRLQLTAELDRAKARLRAHQEEVEALKKSVAQDLPMLADREIDVSGLLKVRSLRIEEENVVGVKLPVLKAIDFAVTEYSWFAKPPWVDALVDRLRQGLELREKMKVSAERVRLLERALRRVTQRVNLFSKILIPTAKKNILKIQIALGDAERAAVGRAKLTKSMRERERTGLPEGALP